MKDDQFQSLDSLDALNRCIEEMPAVLVWFSGPDCRVCSALKPKVAALIERHYPKLHTVQIDCAQSPEAAAQHQVFSVPTLLVFFDRKQFISKTRNFSLAELKSELERPYHLFFG